MPRSLRAAWRFFLANAGYSVPPGRAACAFALAKAERDAGREGLTFEWSDDGLDRQDAADYRELTGRDIETCEACVCRDEAGNVLASLSGIWDATPEYRRVVEAELAAEALEEMADAIADAVLSL